MSDNSTPTRKMPLWFKALSWASVVSLIAVIGGILFTETWVEVVEEQLHELKSGDIEKAYYEYTSRDFQSKMPLDKFRVFAAAHPILFQNPYAHFSNRGIHHNVSILKGKLTSLDHRNIPIEYRLIKEGNSWKILSIRIFEKEQDMIAENDEE